MSDRIRKFLIEIKQSELDEFKDLVTSEQGGGFTINNDVQLMSIFFHHIGAESGVDFISTVEIIDIEGSNK